MIVHLVLFRVSPTLSADDRVAFVRSLEKALVDIPAIERATVGRRVTIGAGYEAGMPHYDYVAALEFANEAALREYLSHPAHAELGTRLFSSAEAVLAYDFDAVPGDRVRNLLSGDQMLGRLASRPTRVLPSEQFPDRSHDTWTILVVVDLFEQVDRFANRLDDADAARPRLSY